MSSSNDLHGGDTSRRRTAADRQRRYRQRLARRLLAYRVEIPAHLVEAMIDLRRLTDDEASSAEHVQIELEAMIGEYLSILQKTVTRNA